MCLHLGARWCCTADKGPKLLSYRELTRILYEIQLQKSKLIQTIQQDCGTISVYMIVCTAAFSLENDNNLVNHFEKEAVTYSSDSEEITNHTSD